MGDTLTAYLGKRLVNNHDYGKWLLDAPQHAES